MNFFHLILKFVLLFKVSSAAKKCLREYETTTLPPLPAFVTNEIVDTFDTWKEEVKIDINVETADGREKLINFATNLIQVNEHNEKFERGEIPFALKLNDRAFLSLEEKRATMNGLMLKSTRPLQTVNARTMTELPFSAPPPASLDYRKLGYVAEVVDQGYICSSCFAFSACAAIEGAIFKKYGILQKLSEQVIIDCNHNPITGNWGCGGGWMSAVFEYVIGNNGTETASTYPFEEFQNVCRFNATRSSIFLKSYGFVVGDEEDLRQALSAVGPLALGVNGALETFFNYGKGIYDEPDCVPPINHAVTLVGYGTDTTFSPPKNYWIIKNSWGTTWGEAGYMRIVRGKNMCGITSYVVYPIV